MVELPGAATYGRRDALRKLAGARAAWVLAAACLGMWAHTAPAEEKEGEAQNKPRRDVKKLAEDMAGVLGVIRSAMLKAGDFSGPVRAEKVKYKFIEAENVSAVVEKKGKEWRIREIRGTVAGGEMTGSVEITDNKEGKSDYTVELVFQNVELAGLCRMAGMTPYGGRVRGKVNLCARGGVEQGLSGAGSFYVADTDLAKVPTLVKVVGLLGAPSISRTKFNTAEAHFTLTPGRVVFQSIEVSASDGSVKVRSVRNGAICYADKALDFVVEPVIEARVLSGMKLAGEFASTVLKMVEGRVARIRVEGTLDEPVVTWSPHR